MVILENIDIDIDIDKAILQNIDIDKISNRFKFGISNRATSKPAEEKPVDVVFVQVGNSQLYFFRIQTFGHSPSIRRLHLNVIS